MGTGQRVEEKTINNRNARFICKHPADESGLKFIAYDRTLLR